MELVTEYLIIIEKSASEALYHLCDSTDGFKKLLQTDSNISVSASHLKYKGKFEYPYEVMMGNVQGKEQRYFQVRLTLKGEENDIDEYSGMLKAVRGIVQRSGGQLETLTDDVAFHFSYKSYPLIHKVENLMRKLITYFMLTNVGKEWVVEASPSSVKEAIDRSKRKQYVDVLHQIDFIHLGEFLFKPYQTKSITELYDRLEAVQNAGELDLQELKDFRAKSNWERYFSKVVDCDDKFLNKRWTQLYDLRCMVAHNALMNKNDYERIIQLVSEVSEHLQKAIDNLDKIHVPKEDKEQIAENVASNISSLYGSFIQLWKEFESTLIKAVVEIKEGNHPLDIRSAKNTLHILYKHQLISENLLHEGWDLTRFRNVLLHDPSAIFSEQELTANINRVEKLIHEIHVIGGRNDSNDSSNN